MGEARLGAFGAIVQPVPTEAWQYPAAVRSLPDHDYVKPIPTRDQDDIGSCTGFMVRGLLQIAATVPVELSPLGLYYFNRVESHLPVGQDTGAHLEASVKAAMRYGAGSEILHPYDTARFTEAPSAAWRQQALDHKALGFYRAHSLDQIRTAISDGHGVGCGFRVPTRFSEAGATGVWPEDDSGDVGAHAVVTVGYDDRLAMFLVQNSWGQNWGRAHVYAAPGAPLGYFHVPYEVMADRSRFFDHLVVTAVDSEAGR